ncbi:MAG: hypothetical protein WA747_10920 [Steroidobacteraceae bacterium]
MNAVRNWLVKLAALALCAAAAAAPVAVAPVFTPLAHSTLVTVDAAIDAGTLMLRVQRTASQAPAAVTNLQVTLDGRTLPVTPRPDGTWSAALGHPAGRSDGTLDVTVTHDGVREILTARLPGAAATAGGDTAGDHTAGGVAALLSSHKQLAWWVLNIAVVLIGVIAVSRRMS